MSPPDSQENRPGYASTNTQVGFSRQETINADLGICFGIPKSAFLVGWQWETNPFARGWKDLPVVVLANLSQGALGLFLLRSEVVNDVSGFAFKNLAQCLEGRESHASDLAIFDV